MVSERLVANAEYAARFLDLVGNEKRFLILLHLAGGEVSVGDLSNRVGLSQSAVSQHLAKLLRLDLVIRSREQQTIHYSCMSMAFREILHLMESLVAADKLPSRRLQKYVERDRFEAA